MGTIEYYLRRLIAIAMMVLVVYLIFLYINPCKNGGAVCSVLGRLWDWTKKAIGGLFRIGAN